GDAGLPGLVAEEPVEALRLETEQVRCLHGLDDLLERDPPGGGAVCNCVSVRSSRGARGSQEGFLPYGVCAHARVRAAVTPREPVDSPLQLTPAGRAYAGAVRPSGLCWEGSRGQSTRKATA